MTDFKKMLYISLAFNFVLLLAGIVFYAEKGSLQGMNLELTEERDLAVAKVAKLEEQLRGMKGRFAMMNRGQGGKPGMAEGDELARLKEALDRKEQELNRLKSQAERRGNRRGNAGGNMKQRMEELKQRDPERYQQMVEMQERRQTEEKSRAEKREQYLSRLDMNALSGEQRQAVADYQEALKRQEQMRQQMENGEMNPENMRNMFQETQQLNQLSTQVQNILLEQYANTLSRGSGAAAVEEIRSIMESTQTRPAGGPGMGGMGGFGGPGPR